MSVEILDSQCQQQDSKIILDVLGDVEMPILEIDDVSAEAWPTSPSCWSRCISE